MIQDDRNLTANTLIPLKSRRSGGRTGECIMGWQETSWLPKDLRKKCTNAKFMFGNIEDLHKIWSPVDVCYERPEKYIAEGLLSIVNFRR
jgi:hypothetical protein